MGSGCLTSFPSDGIAVVVGATGGIGGALVEAIEEADRFAEVVALSRRSRPALDLTAEITIADAAAAIGRRGRDVRLVVDATGLLHGGGIVPEKTWRQIDPDAMARAFAINAIGPAMLLKHMLPLLPREGKAMFATLSARVGSIGDNRLGGWYAYRASKAALNQIVRTAAIELARIRPAALCIALHPGTVATRLSEPFESSGRAMLTPAQSARLLLQVIDRATPADNGYIIDQNGERIPW